jgi:endonuclease/exonuclease/phosphatase family metal-dependent hydrolase
VVRLTVTTWNLQGSAGVDVAAVAAHLRDVGADVVLFQEVQRRQARALAAALGAESWRWGFKHWPVKIPAEGMAVLGVTGPVRVRTVGVTRRWRFWSWRRRIVQLARFGGVALVNVHLTPHGPGEDEDRDRELRWVLAHVDAAIPTVVAGDFNAPPRSPLFDHLRRAGLHDAPDPGPTNWRGARTGPPTRRLDRVWSTPAVADAHVPPFAAFARLSDHLRSRRPWTFRRRCPARRRAARRGLPAPAEVGG